MTAMVKLVLIGVTTFTLLACHERDEKNVEKKDYSNTTINGGKFYSDGCLACHNYKSSVDGDSTTLLKMAALDSSTLLRKLQSLNNNDIHKNYLLGGKLSEEEITALLTHIKRFSGAVP